MSEKLEIRVLGEPKEKARHRSRFVRPKDGRPGFIQNYSDPTTAKYEHRIQHAAQQAMAGRDSLLEGPLRVTILAFRSMPNFPAWKRKAVAERTLRPTTKPDLDNLVKVVDALNKVVWNDDSQIVDITARKYFSEIPELVITVEELPLPIRPARNVRAAADQPSVFDAATAFVGAPT